MGVPLCCKTVRIENKFHNQKWDTQCKVPFHQKALIHSTKIKNAQTPLVDLFLTLVIRNKAIHPSLSIGDQTAACFAKTNTGLTL